MSKMVAGVLFVWICLTILASFCTGAGGINATYLTAPMAATDNSATVNSTAGFLPGGDILFIGGEQMTYSSTDYTHFYGLTRTNGVAHAALESSGVPTMVYSQQTNLVNDALGYNVSQVVSSSSFVAVFTIPYKFFSVTLPAIISGQGIMPLLPGVFAFIGYFWLAMTAGVAVSFGVQLAWLLSGLVGKLL